LANGRTGLRITIGTYNGVNLAARAQQPALPVIGFATRRSCGNNERAGDDAARRRAPGPVTRPARPRFAGPRRAQAVFERDELAYLIRWRTATGLVARDHRRAQHARRSLPALAAHAGSWTSQDAA
jgi:hypothetical protein